MVTSQLIDYIRSQLAAGIAPEEVRQSLATGGWSQNDIDAGIRMASYARDSASPVPVAPTGQSPQTITSTKKSWFSGRINRKTYLLGLVLIPVGCFLIGLLLSIPFFFLGFTSPVTSLPLILVLICVFGIPAALLALSLAVRRLHDIGFSGWYILIPNFLSVLSVIVHGVSSLLAVVLSLLVFVFGLVLLIKGGNAAVNGYGSPQEVGAWRGVWNRRPIVGMTLSDIRGLIWVFLISLLLTFGYVAYAAFTAQPTVNSPQINVPATNVQSEATSTQNSGSPSVAPSPSATIDQSSLTPSVGTYAITGTAYNTGAVIIAGVHSSYSGSTDYNSVFAFASQNPGTAYVVLAPVENNRWSIRVTTLNPSLVETILLYDPSTHILLTTGTLKIKSSSTNSASPTTSSLSASPSSCVTLYSNILLGSSGAEVIKLQNYLIAQNDLAAGNNSGYFGAKTQAALEAWQSAHGIPATGRVDAQTQSVAACD